VEDKLILVVIIFSTLAAVLIFAISYIEIGLYMRVVKELYNTILEALDYRNQSVFSKPFYIVGALLLSVLLAIPVCAFVLRCLERDLEYQEQ